MEIINMISYIEQTMKTLKRIDFSLCFALPIKHSEKTQSYYYLLRIYCIYRYI